jgi:hypothetical protein
VVICALDDLLGTEGGHGLEHLPTFGLGLFDYELVAANGEDVAIVDGSHGGQKIEGTAQDGELR